MASVDRFRLARTRGQITRRKDGGRTNSATRSRRRRELGLGSRGSGPRCVDCLVVVWWRPASYEHDEGRHQRSGRSRPVCAGEPGARESATGDAEEALGWTTEWTTDDGRLNGRRTTDDGRRLVNHFVEK